MARRKIFLFLVSLFLAHMSYQSSMFVLGDAALFDKICSNTVVPEYCYQCFHSNPRTNQEDERGLGGISINCAYQQSLLVRVKLVDLAAQQTDNAAKQVFMDCANDMDTGGDNIIKALLSWADKRYVDSADQASAAFEATYSCAMKLDSVRGLLPEDFVPSLVALENFCQDASGVVKQII